MRKTILTIRDGQCRFPVTDDNPFLFCGEVTALDRVYCDEHHERCHAGYGKDVRLLELMMRTVETTVFHLGRNRDNTVRGMGHGFRNIESSTTEAVDVVVRG